MGVISVPYPKNYPLRDAIYELLGNGYMQRDILMLLKEKGFILGKSRLSQIIKDLEQEEYITCGLRSSYKSYIITKKPYPYISRSLQIPRCPRKRTLRAHNIFYKYKIIGKTNMTNDLKRWDRIIPIKNGVTQYIYYGHDNLEREITIQRFEGKKNDTLILKIPDMNWDYDTLDDFDEFLMRKCIRAEYAVMHQFKMRLEFIGRSKISYAICPAPYSELQQAFMTDNYVVGDLQGDSSKGIPELETDKREKAIAIMEFLNLSDSGRLPELFDIFKKIKEIGIPLETILDVMQKKNDEIISKDKENHERGVL